MQRTLFCFVVTYIAEMPQWLPALSPAESYSEKPMRETVGAMVKGPMKRMRKPMRPEKPTKIWRREATMMEPCTCGTGNTKSLSVNISSHCIEIVIGSFLVGSQLSCGFATLL